MNLEDEIASLHGLTTKQLKRRFAELTCDATHANNRPWLIKRLAWRLQAKAHGGLSDRAKTRAAELADDADLRVIAPRDAAPAPQPSPAPSRGAPACDDRLPPPGSFLTRRYKGCEVRVAVLAHGFEWGGKVFASLSAVAKAVTGSHCNGFLFFNLTGGKR